MLKKILVSITAAAVLGVGGVTVAGAVSSSHASPAAASAAASRPRYRSLKAAAQEAARVIGISVATLRTEVKAKGTIAAVATAHGVSPQSVIDAIVTKADTAIDRAVANHKLDATKAAALKAKVPGLAGQFVNDTTNFLQHRRQANQQRRLRRRHHAIKTAAVAIGVNPSDIRAALAQGHSVADVAAAHHVSTQTVIDALVKQANTNVDNAVSAGRISAARAKVFKARMAQMFTHLVDHKGFGPNARTANQHKAA